MSWPLSQDYNEAIQSPASNFTDPDLKRGEAVANALGLPMPYSGNFADVYQVRCPDGSRWAVKCFTREALGLHERYQEISNHLKQAKLPFSVDCSYLDKGIRVGGQWYPVLKMQWVEGLTLNQFTAQYLDKPAMLEALLQLWAKMGKYLRAAEIGHCDLQHGNILLVPGSTPGALALKLIDYDGMWVPALAGKKSGEVGHPSYQHPQRLREGTYSLDVDRFPLLLVATAMRAVKADKGLWAKYDNGDNMLFKEPDLAAPGRSELFEELSSLPDAGLVMLAAHVRAALKGSLESAPLLEDAMPDAKGAPMPARPSKAASGPPSGAGLAKSAPKVAPVAVAPVVVQPPKEAKTFAFDETAPDRAASAPSRARLKTKLKAAKAESGGVPVAVWAGGGAAAAVVLVGAVTVFIMTRGSGDKPPAGPPVVQTQPASGPDKGPVKPAVDHGSAPSEKDGPGHAPTEPQDPANSVPGQWHDLDLGAATDQDGVITIRPQTGGIRTRAEYAGPIEITVAAKTEKEDIRLHAFNGASVIFNWQTNMQELRVTRPDGNEKPESGSLATAKVQALAPNTWYTLGWRITPEGMDVSVDGGIVFSERKKYDLSAKCAVAVSPWDSAIQVKSLAVKKLETPSFSQDLVGEVRRFEGHTGEIRRLAVSPDGKQLLSAGFDNTLRLWDVATNRELLKVEGPAGQKMHGVAFLPDGKRAFSCNLDDKNVHLWDLTDGHEIRSYSGHTDHVVNVAVSRDGLRAASCGLDGVAILWDVEAGNVLHRLEEKSGGVQTVAFSPDGKFLLTGADRGAVRLWDVESGKELRRFGCHASNVMGLAFSPDGKLAISSSFDKTACIWRVADGHEVRRFAGFTSSVWCAVFSHDGQQVLTGDDGTMRLWDAETGKELYRFQGGAWDAAYSPDGRYAFSAQGGDKGSLKMWRLPPADYVPPPTADTTPVVKKPEPKPAAPDDAAQAAAEKEVKDLYKAEYAKKKKEDVLALADKLRQQGIDTKDKPATRFVLFRESRDLAARAGDFGLSRRAVDEMVNDFAVNVQEMNVQAVEAAARAILAPAALVHIAEAGLPLAEEAVDADDYDMADRAIKAAGAAAHSASNSAMEKVTSARAAEIEALRKAWEPAGAAAQTLATKPDDPDASLALGAFFCLDKGDWGRGLPLLAQGSDKTLKALAQADLDAVADPAAQMDLAKTYQSQADGEAGPRKAQFLRRACFWYQKARAQLMGVSGAEVEKKIDEVEKNLPVIRPAVVRAYYGAYNDWPEVTDKVRTLLVQAKGPKPTVKADAGELGIPNHDNHQAKTLVIVYQVGGQTCLSLTSEGGTATLPAIPGAMDVDAARPGPGQNLLVLAARYGAEGNWADLTPAAQHLVKDSSLTTPSDGLGLASIDPAFGKHKALVVVYRYGNRVRFSVTPHDQPIAIGAVPATP